MTSVRSPRRWLSRPALLALVTVVLAISTGSRVPLHASGGTTVYGRLYTQDTVFSTTLQSADETSGVLAAPNDARQFSAGQLARVWLDCAALRGLPPGTPGGDLCNDDPTQTRASAQVVLTAVDRATGAVTWYGYDFDLPIAPLPGSEFDSILFGPGNLSVDAAGRTYVVDTWNSRIAVFGPDGHALYSIGHYGSVYTVLNDPTDANDDGVPDNPMNGYPVSASDPLAACYDSLYDLDALSNCPNDPTKLLGLFNNPNDVAVFPDGTLVIADAGNHRIQLLKPSTTGAVVASDGATRFAASTLGTWGLGLGQPVGNMSFPGGVAAGANGRIAVADTDNSRIQVFDPSSSGSIVASDGTKYSGFTFGQHGESAGGQTVAFEFNYPLDVAFDPTGRIIVADSGNNQVKVYDPTGDDIALLGGEPGLDPGQFNYPWGASADPSGNLLVADTFGQRIQELTESASGYDPNSPVSLPIVYSPVGVASTPLGGFMATEFEKHRIVRLAPLGLTIQNSIVITNTTVASGATVPVTFTVLNSGLVPLTNVQPQLTGATTVACANPGPTSADLAVNATATFTLCFEAGDPNTTSQVQVGAIGSSGTMQEMATPKNAPAVTVLPAGAGIGMTAAISSSRVQVNNTFTVQLQLTNRGSVPLTGVTLALSPTAGVTFLSGSSDSLARPNLAVAGSSSATLTFRADAAEPLEPMTVTVTANEINPDTGRPVTATAAVSLQIVTDVDPPVITGVRIVGPLGESPNQFGWIQYGPASLTITATDTGVGLAQIGYKAITLQTGSQSYNGQNSASYTGTGFYSHGQGNTLVAFWAEDLAGNAAAHNLIPGPTENVSDFCKRLPAQCVTVNVDPLKPYLDHWPVQISDDNTQAFIPFNASDSQSGVWTVQMAYPQPGAQIVMDPDSNSRGTLILTSEGPEVFGDVTVTDYAGLQNTFRLPFQGDPSHPALRLDRTPPEAYNQVDPTALGSRCTTTVGTTVLTYWCTNKVYGTDNFPGLTTNAFAPTSVLPVRWGGDDDSAGDPKFDGIAELHTYSFTDEYIPATGPEPYQNPNRVTLVEKVRQDGNEARVHVMSYQYQTGKSAAGPVIVPDWAYKKYEWAKNNDGSLKTLNQKFELHRGLERWQVLANYDGKSNTTRIQDLGPYPTKNFTLPGLVLLKMTTWHGSLWIEYPGSTPPPVTTPPPTTPPPTTPPPSTGGFTACSPGYWKNHVGAWPTPPYSPTQTTASVFPASSPYGSVGTSSLLSSLSGGGGSGINGAATILARSGVAAALNAVKPGLAYPRSILNVLSDVNGAFASNDVNTMLSLASTLDYYNNYTCPLN